MSLKWRAFLLAAPSVAGLDQLTKWGVRRSIDEYETVAVLGSFFGITHVRNPGTALGFFRDLPVEFFVGLAAVGLFVVGALLLRSEASDGFAGFALGLIVGGAIGNLVDRFYFHEVVDFLRFDFGLFVFPPFNVADAAIVSGAGLLLLDVETPEPAERSHGPREGEALAAGREPDRAGAAGAPEPER